MSEIENLTPPGWVIRRRWLPVLLLVLSCAALCIGVTGIYAGSTIQSTKSADDIAALKQQMAQQKIEYEQRLGKQSAQYAIDVNNFALAIANFGRAIDRMDVKNDRRAAERERAQAVAVAAAQKAALAAAATAQKTEQIAVKQDVMQQQVTEAASAAKATEKKLDSVQHSTAAVPATPWVGNHR